jgi:hypothetical protein
MTDFMTFCLDTEADAVKLNDAAIGRIFVEVLGPFTNNDLMVFCLLDTPPGSTSAGAIGRAGNKVAVHSKTP